MNSVDVLKLYADLQANNIPIWIDGGWCVDALLGRQTRPHADLDLAVEQQHEPPLRALLLAWGYCEESRDNSTAWNFILKDASGRRLDIHVFAYDEQGKHIYGIPYPYGSLTGTGFIDGQMVNSISPEWMFQFKTAYQPAEKDLQDVQALADQFGFRIPASHQIKVQ